MVQVAAPVVKQWKVPLMLPPTAVDEATTAMISVAASVNVAGKDQIAPNQNAHRTAMTGASASMASVSVIMVTLAMIVGSWHVPGTATIKANVSMGNVCALMVMLGMTAALRSVWCPAVSMGSV